MAGTKWTVWVVAAATLTVGRASAQDACACARAACEAMSAMQHQSADRCAALASAPSQACTSASAGMLQALHAAGQAVPRACVAAAIGGASPAGGAAPAGHSSPATPGGSGGAAPTHPDEQASPPPTPLPPDVVTPVHASSGNLACTLERVRGRRVAIAGTTETFEVRCVGIPVAGRRGGDGSPTVPPQRTSDGRTVQIRWSATAGTISGPFATATYIAPAAPPSPAEVMVNATVALVDARGRSTESVALQRPVHVVARHLHLELASRFVTHCQAPTGGSVTVGFDLQCTESIDLDVEDDFAVHGTGGGSCGAGTLTSVQPCAPFVTSATAEPGWSFDTATGQIDPDSGVLDLQVTGNRIGFPRVSYSDGRVDPPHAVPLFPRPFSMSPDDGSVRSFGSLGTNATAGGTNVFTLRAR